MKNIFLQDIIQPMMLIEAKTGITYYQQCGGSGCDHRGAEGYLIPVRAWRDLNAADPIKLLTYAIDSRDLVNVTQVFKAMQIDAYIDDEHFDVELDLSRSDDILEAWVPVTVKGERAWLLWENSD